VLIHFSSCFEVPFEVLFIILFLTLFVLGAVEFGMGLVPWQKDKLDLNFGFPDSNLVRLASTMDHYGIMLDNLSRDGCGFMSEGKVEQLRKRRAIEMSDMQSLYAIHVVVLASCSHVSMHGLPVGVSPAFVKCLSFRFKN